MSTGIPAGGAKFDVADSEVARGLELLKTSAKTDAEKRSAEFLDMLHNNAVLNAPTRALAAGDFFKIMNARIELKRQTMMETLSETRPSSSILISTPRSQKARSSTVK